MEPKKISFSFSKTKQKPNILPQKQPEVKEKVEYITSFDKDTIQLSEKKEFIIPVKNNYSVAERISDKKRKESEAVSDNTSPNAEGNQVSIEQLAIRELIADAKNPVEKPTNISTMEIPMNTSVVKESEETANYDNVPVTEFGYAMLRGMGWAPGKGIGKKQKIVDVHVPELRARGLGLGAAAPAKE